MEALNKLLFLSRPRKVILSLVKLQYLVIQIINR